MAQENLVQEGVDRVREAVSSIEGDFQRVQKRVEKGINARRKTIEKQVRVRRKRAEASAIRVDPEIEHEAPLVRIRVDEGKACPSGRHFDLRRLTASRISTTGLDLDHFRSQIGEELPAIGDRRRGQVQYT